MRGEHGVRKEAGRTKEKPEIQRWKREGAGIRRKDGEGTVREGGGGLRACSEKQENTPLSLTLVYPA